MSWTCMQSFSFIPLTASEEKVFEYFFENLSFVLPWQPIKFSDLDKIHMNRRGLHKKHFCKKNLNSCSETAKIADFHFSHYKSMETARVLIRLEQKHNYSPPPPLAPSSIDPICGIWKESASRLQRRSRLKMLTTDDGRTDGRRMPAYTISSPMSLRLRWVNQGRIRNVWIRGSNLLGVPSWSVCPTFLKITRENERIWTQSEVQEFE